MRDTPPYLPLPSWLRILQHVWKIPQHQLTMASTPSQAIMVFARNLQPLTLPRVLTDNIIGVRPSAFPDSAEYQHSVDHQLLWSRT